MLLETFNKWAKKRPNEPIPNNVVINRFSQTKRKAIDTDRMNNIIKAANKLTSEGIYREDENDPFFDGSFNLDGQGEISYLINQCIDSMPSQQSAPIASPPVQTQVTQADQVTQQEVVNKINTLGESFKTGFKDGINSWLGKITDFFNKPIFGIALRSWLIWGAIILIFVYVCYIIAKHYYIKIKQYRKTTMLKNENTERYNNMIRYNETDFLSKSKDFAKTSYEKGKNAVKNIYDKGKNAAADAYDKGVDFTSNAYNKGKELASNAAPKFEEALKSGCNYVLNNKGKFIGGGALLGVITKIYSDRSLITEAYKTISQMSPEARATGIDDMFYGLSSMVTNAKGFWEKCKAIYVSFLKGAGASSAAPTAAAGKGLSGIKSFFSQVFTDKGIAWKGTSGGHFVLYGIAALVLALIIWVAYKIIKKIIARRNAKATAESYIEAENVAFYLRENTDMSKKDCNKIANFVYRKSLDRRLLNF